MNISPYLKLMVEKKASDLYFTSNAPVKIKIEGKVISVGKNELNAEAVKAAAYGVMTPEQIQFFESNMECDFAIAEEGVGRFRVNVFRQRGQVAMVLRYIPSNIPRLEDLNLPEVLKDLIMHKRGLLLMVGATGSGKSTTLAAMINHRNENSTGHILTIEDPIEFTHPNKGCIVNQREIGVDTHSYHNALKSSLREAPDVILIGEIRDRETMEAAIELAGTGHLAISTLHANNAFQTMDRIVNMFPEQLHKQLFMDLSLNLRGIISQRLVMGKDGKRVAAVEVMLNTPHIADLILKGQIDDLREAMAESPERGMQTFDQALYNLYKEGRIELEEALRNADSRANLEAKINFG
ncbi:MAG TPA: PilT/PilU family type 4a pilus ATPase [Gammaproteobacteria bacterium]|nr:PilT/PilU family type 4a pilus ATPase [Gammaproteobacteria bacterium]